MPVRQCLTQSGDDLARIRDRKLPAAIVSDNVANTLVIETQNWSARGQRFQHHCARCVTQAGKGEDIGPIEIAPKGLMMIEPAKPTTMLIDTEPTGRLPPTIFQRTTAENVQFVGHIRRKSATASSRKCSALRCSNTPLHKDFQWTTVIENLAATDSRSDARRFPIELPASTRGDRPALHWSDWRRA